MIKKLLKIIKWIPILWKDEDWDHSYFIAIMRFKLERMFEFFNSSRSVTNWNTHKSELKALRICIEILKRKENDFYFNTFSKLIDTGVKFIPINDPVIKNQLSDEDIYMIDPKWEISSNMPLYEKKSNLANAAEKDRNKLLYKLLEVYVESWWD